jgi:hypothetical protein
MKVLVCPLDWGLGHATRSIPLIKSLQQNGHQVIVGASGGGARLLGTEFPELKIFTYPGYRVRYSRSPAFFLPVMLMQMPALLMSHLREQAQLRRILAEHSPDLVISDGRYGVFTRSVPCVFITHQVFIRVPGRFPGIGFLERLVLRLNLWLLGRFAEVWVPDFPGPKTLSGDLSHKPCNLSNLVYIHPLSRFGPEDGYANKNSHAKQGQASLANSAVDILAMVSGPEPQRGLFESALMTQLSKMSGTRVLVRGLPDATAGILPEDLSIPSGQLSTFNHLPGTTLAILLRRANLVVARSGYTTVMELAGIGVKTAVLVPTPGQSEQEYLADHLEKSRTALRMDQEDLDLAKATILLQSYSGFTSWSGIENTESPSKDSGSNFTLDSFLKSHRWLQNSNLVTRGLSTDNLSKQL